MSFIYHTFFLDPIYNLLIALFNILPWVDAGVIIILLTLIVRFVLYPLSKKAVVTQMRMAEIAPELNVIKEKYKDSSEEQARQTLALYRDKGVNPFSGILVILIQIPIIFALYRIFMQFPVINQEILYSFVPVPENINTIFLGLVDLTQKSLVLAILAAVSTLIQSRISLSKQPAPQGDSFSDNLARSMQTQVKYVFPIIIFFVSFSISGSIALYLLTTNVFSIAQELLVRRKKPIQA